MLHACFVCIPTCFMCTLIQYLIFLGTNLLTRCHSASYCFLLFLYFRKVVQEIFSELHGTKTQHLRIPSRSHSQKGSCGRPARWLDNARRGPTSGRAWGLSGHPWRPPIPPLRPYMLHLGKTIGES